MKKETTDLIRHKITERDIRSVAPVADGTPGSPFTLWAEEVLE